MSHINYFRPYESKSANHEDQLTRAFMVVLRYVPTTLLIFYDSIVNDINKKALRKNKRIDIIPLSDIDLSNTHFEIQTQKINRTFKTNKIISVLITDESFDTQGKVSKSDRIARYDGVIYTDDITIIIENKPSKYNVWEEQLSPSMNSLPEEAEIIEIAAILEWKKIIKNLNNLIKYDLIGKTEKEIIRDFLDFVDEEFPLINPYDNLIDCKDNEELLNRRIRNILVNSVTKQEDIVEYHMGWHCHYIKTPFPEIWMIGFPIINEENGWNLRIELWFGDTLSQSRALYENKINYCNINSLEKKGWQYMPNFHISFMQKHLVWLNTPNSSKEKYIQYWNNNISDIRQYTKPELKRLLEKSVTNQIITIDEEDKTEIENNITKTNRNKFYISTGFGLVYTLNSRKAIELDSNNELSNEIKNKINEGLSILNKNNDFLNQKTI